MMQQYAAAKDEAAGALLLFRMGDFYELFGDDAHTAAEVLGIAVTSRDKDKDGGLAMAGFPHQALDSHLPKLIAAGHRVAVCDQLEDASQAKGLVRRGITRVLTPGTLADTDLMDPKTSSLLVAVAPASRGKPAGIAWVDFASGLFQVADVPAGLVAEELTRLEPAEIVFAEDCAEIDDWLRNAGKPTRTPRPGWQFNRRNAVELLCEHFGVASLDGFGIAEESSAPCAAGALLAYLQQTQKAGLKHLSRLTPHHRGRAMVLDPVTRRSLELTRTLRDGRREGTLLDVMDTTVTSAGARRLARWLGEPLMDPTAIGARHTAVAEWKDDPLGREQVRGLLKRVHDVGRMIARIDGGRANPRDLAALRDTLDLLPALKAKLSARDAPLNAELEQSLELFPELSGRLRDTLQDEPPLSVRDGGIVRTGFDDRLDQLRAAARGGKQWIASFQARESQRTGIGSLKVGFNKVFGYYLEITNAHKDKVPPEYDRKQTLKNAERYVTPELKEYEQKVLGAEDRAKDLEHEIFQDLRTAVATELLRLQRLADTLADVDVVAALAELAVKRLYVRPKVVEEPVLVVKGGRHPVLDVSLPAGRFIPNDTALGEEHGTLHLITGPNMAGKSTYIRQVALITLMAQVGSFVPAEAATVGIADRIFTRVGASDELGRGQSTFMVEMSETANILNNASRRSLVILDEIGRGTSTYDGVSLAWAIAEHLHDVAGCRTLFATHYHELIELAGTLPSLRNFNVAVREWQDEIVFLHQIATGGADRSYGIHVARLAGVPDTVLQRAQAILHQLEKDPFGQSPQASGRPKKHRRTYHQLSLFPSATAHPILDELRMTGIDDLTPDQALATVKAWQDRLREE